MPTTDQLLDMLQGARGNHRASILNVLRERAERGDALAAFYMWLS